MDGRWTPTFAVGMMRRDSRAAVGGESHARGHSDMTSATPDRTSSGRRLAYLDGLRACASVFVLIHHTFVMAYPISLGVRPHGALGVIFGWAVYGHFGVTVFIALAGYSLALGIAGRGGDLPGGAIGFMQRRAGRIIPPYWAALAITVLLAATVIGDRTGTHWDLSTPTDPGGWLVDFFLVQDIFIRTDAAYTFWSIAVEWHIYLLLPLLLLVRRATGSWKAAIGFGVTGSLLALVAARLVPVLQQLHPEYYLLFAMAAGACVAVRLRPQTLARLPLLTFAGAALAGVVAICIAQPYAWVVENFDWIDVLLGAAVICLVMHLSLREQSRAATALSAKPLATVGLFSYSLYLVHAPLLALAWKYVLQPLEISRGTQLLLGWLVVVPVITAIAYGFYLVFERPFVGRKPKRVLRAEQARHETPSPAS